MPNAGKSTCWRAVSATRPEIADYPFTTLEPNLGVVVVDDRDIVLADIPGLIEGAHTGRGLGHTFLRHIERTRVLIHLLDGISPDPVGDYDAINQELALFAPMLADKPQVVVLNKMDLPDVRASWPGIATKTAGVGRGRATGDLRGDRRGGAGSCCAAPPICWPELPAFFRGEAIRPQSGAKAGVVAPEERASRIDARADGTWHVHGRPISSGWSDDPVGILRRGHAFPTYHGGVGHHRGAATPEAFRRVTPCRSAR